MKKDEMILSGLIGQEEISRSKSFWRRAFFVYAITEIFILATQYIITRTKCSHCVLPPAFYGVNLLQHLLFTGLLWFCLNQFYYLVRWKVVILNIVLFLGHYFLWISALYGIFHAGQNWLVWDKVGPRSFSFFIYGSWIDIGKYVLKLSAFYVLKFYYEYRKAERQRIQLAIMNRDMQLNLLKQQLSPHFYFNTLNNL